MTRQVSLFSHEAASSDALAGTPFHPAVAGWFRDSFEAPTAVQEAAWRATAKNKHALIAAPTGSGKTLAAFLAAINQLVCDGLAGTLDAGVLVLYVSPLKALSNDIQQNLQQPLSAIRQRLQQSGLPDVDIRDGLRTGDTPQSERQRMRRSPPHILVTTPESLYLLLTSDSGRNMLSSVRTVIIDELHAVAASKRGSHLALSLERLNKICDQMPVRIGLSATQKPMQRMAALLMGSRSDDCEIVDTGHHRERDIAMEVPSSPLEAVMAGEVWTEIYDRLAALGGAHRTTLVFVNTRRMAERVARHVAERLGDEQVDAHHGSLSKEHRLNAERRLRDGELRVLVCTASLELGIDIGDIDLVCQLGSPRSIAAFLQRVGRAGHGIGRTPKGRLFPLSVDDLAECTALLDAVRRRELDELDVPVAPLDVLAQQIVAEVSCGECDADQLFATFSRAWPYRDLPRERFDSVLTMLAEGYSTRRGRRGAYIHWDTINGRLRARRGARITAVTNGGVIPDQFDYEVKLMPEGFRVGTLNEDFAFESLAGDIFQLGNTSYRILKIETGTVFVEDARGQPPNIPFWFGEAPGRSDMLSNAVSRLNGEIEALLTSTDTVSATQAVVAHLKKISGLPNAAASQVATYLVASFRILGRLPQTGVIILERFPDDSGDMHLVIHSVRGSRFNRAWGLALRKRFCRKFNFELQASALEDSLVLSLGPTHSFPLDDVWRYLSSTTVRDVLVQALLDAPMFPTHWRWSASVAFAIRRMNGGKRVPPQFQRTDAEDLMAVVFPDQLACAENLAGRRDVPDHPLVQQSIHDCLTDVMDIDALERMLGELERGEIACVARDLPAPSPLSESILNARPYAFLDDGEAEERRTRIVSRSPWRDGVEEAGAGQIDSAAVATVQQQVWPIIRDPDELHDALLIAGVLSEAEIQTNPGLHDAAKAAKLIASLVAENRVFCFSNGAGLKLVCATERAADISAIYGVELPTRITEMGIGGMNGSSTLRESAIIELVRGRLSIAGPVCAAELSSMTGLSASAIETALLALETEGYAFRGALMPSVPDTECWCERGLLTRIYRLSLQSRRKSVTSVSPAQFMRFLLSWHGLNEGEQAQGRESTRRVIRQLEGFPAAAASWEPSILTRRVKDYRQSYLDELCASGQVTWFRPIRSATESGGASPIRTTPIVIATRSGARHWSERPIASANDEAAIEESLALSERAKLVKSALEQRGAMFFDDIALETALSSIEVEPALAELVAAGHVTSDSFVGLRNMLRLASSRSGRRGALRRQRSSSVLDAGRWALRHANGSNRSPESLEHVAKVLLARYGVVFRALLVRETLLPPWRELLYVLRRMEARGEIAGGRFVDGFSGEQFAALDAVPALYKAEATHSNLVTIDASDPLNLVAVIIPGERVPATSGNRILLRDGKLVAQQRAGEFICEIDADDATAWAYRQKLIRDPGGVSKHRH